MTDTATRILDTAQELIQTRGYSAISIRDIAEIVGIRKPSVIHHFPSKAALGAAVIQRYRLTFDGQLKSINSNPDNSAWDALTFYFEPYLQFAETPDKVCLCGALAGEIRVLPEAMHAEVKRFMESHQQWLEDILHLGVKNKNFQLFDSPRHLARMFFSALQGALLVKRSTGDNSQVEDVIDVIGKTLRPDQA